MPFGASRKLPDLLMKAVVLWSGLDHAVRRRLITFLHVPLDSYTLAAIRCCVHSDAGWRIPKAASMGYVQDAKMYDRLQEQFRDLGRAAGCPAVYLDVLTWNLGHAG
jgi:hypothetical protein